MSTYFETYFPTEFLQDYITQQEDGLERFQIYSIFRFLSAAEKNETISGKELQKKLNYDITPESFDKITDYLSQDYYFSPSFRENSFDTVFLLDAITMVESVDTHGFKHLKEILEHACPHVLSLDFGNISTDMEFYGALATLSFEYPADISEHLDKIAAAYQEDFHFTSEDFVLYDFMDEYFEAKNCRNNPKYLELIDTLVIATLKAQDTSLQACVMETAHKQLQHPYSKFAGLYRYGAIDFTSDFDLEKDCQMFKNILNYAVTQELRSNLFDFHLEEDRIITLDNWKEKLKWYHIQYSNAYELAISSFYAAKLSRKLLKKEFSAQLFRTN